MELCFAHGGLLSGQPSHAKYYASLGYTAGERKPRANWFDVLPEFRDGLYFQQMVKVLNTRV